jgi:hypothetical protein
MKRLWSVLCFYLKSSYYPNVPLPDEGPELIALSLIMSKQIACFKNDDDSWIMRRKLSKIRCGHIFNSNLFPRSDTLSTTVAAVEATITFRLVWLMCITKNKGTHNNYKRFSKACRARSSSYLNWRCSSYKI